MSPVGKRKSSSGSYELSLHDARKVCVCVCVCVCVSGRSMRAVCPVGLCELKSALLLIVMIRIMIMIRIH